MAVSPPICDFDAPWHDFALRDTDGSVVTLPQVAGSRGTLVMFICNHCPYVRSILDRIIRDAHALMDHGIGVVAISSNDVAAYPQDSPAHMRDLAQRNGFRFPYLYDADQSIARAYGAECTPDFFGYSADGRLQYRGRLDASTRTAAATDARRDLYLAMVQIAETGQGPRDQVASMGCSIKWKAA